MPCTCLFQKLAHDSAGWNSAAGRAKNAAGALSAGRDLPMKSS